MASTINASLTAGLVATADTTGNINLQSGGATVVAVTSAGQAVTGTMSASGATSLAALSATSGTFSAASRFDSNLAVGGTPVQATRLSVKQSGTTLLTGMSVEASATDSLLVLYSDGTNFNIRSDYNTTGIYQPIKLWTSGAVAMTIGAGGASAPVTIPGTLGVTGITTLGAAIVGPASATVFNTVSTTVNAFGAATTLNMGNSGGTNTIAGVTLMGPSGVASPGGVGNVNQSSYSGTDGRWALGVANTAASGTARGLSIFYTALAPNDTGNQFFFCYDTAGLKTAILSNGGISNYSANNTNLSDVREKKNIELAGSYLDKICAIPVKTFLFNDQTDSYLNLGVIAQDVEAVAPELVTESNWGTEEAPKIRKTIYETDLKYALMKAIQELAAKVAKLEAA